MRRLIIIICDFMVPEISGIELIVQIRSNKTSLNVPIVMISGHNNYAPDARAKSAGANVFLNKPFRLAVLRSTVETLLNGRLPVASN